MKVAFVLGHTDGLRKEKDKGKFSKWLNQSEWDWYKSFEGHLETLGDVFEHDSNTTSYISRQKKMAIRTKDYDLVIELHFNGFKDSDGDGDGDASGCECLYFDGNKTTEVLAKKFCKLVKKHIGVETRRRHGAIPVTNGRGSGFLKRQIPNALLIEPFFGDNESDCQKIKDSECKLFTKVLRELIEDENI